MLDTDTKRRIDTARDILVGKVPDPKSQVKACCPGRRKTRDTVASFVGITGLAN